MDSFFEWKFSLSFYKKVKSTNLIFPISWTKKESLFRIFIEEVHEILLVVKK